MQYVSQVYEGEYEALLSEVTLNQQVFLPTPC